MTDAFGNQLVIQIAT